MKITLTSFILLFLIAYFLYSNTKELKSETLLNSTISDSPVSVSESKSTFQTLTNHPQEKDSISTFNQILPKEKLEGDEMRELTKFAVYNEYLNEMESADYSNISKFHDLVVYCNSLPKDAIELVEWENKHADQDDVNIEIIRDEVYSCTGIKKYNYSELQSIYFKAQENGSSEALFALAKLTPYESPEKIDLLGRSAALFHDAHTMLVTRAIDGSEFLTMEERYFWMKTYSEKEQFDQEFDTLVSNIEMHLSNHNLELVQKMISEWKNGSLSEKVDVVLNLKEIEK